MPYKSEAQRKFMHSQHPTIAKKWDQESEKVGGDMPAKNPNVDNRMNAINRRMNKPGQSPGGKGIAVGEPDPSGRRGGNMNAPWRRHQKPHQGPDNHGPIQHKPWIGGKGSQPVKNLVKREEIKRQLSRASESNLSQRQAKQQMKNEQRNQAIKNRQSSKE